MKLWLDYETRSATPIKRGHYRYFADPTAYVMFPAYAVDDGPIHVWDRTADSAVPADLEDALLLADEVWACNASFDRTAHKLVPEAPQPELKRWRCMMVRAYLHGLPGKLEKLCEIFALPAEDRKVDGLDYIKLFCVPRADGEFNNRLTHPKEWTEFKAYAGRDIRAMRALDTKIPKWNSTESEWGLWHLDQERNDRGFAVDLGLAEAALRTVEIEKKRLASITTLLTDSDVLRPTQRDKLLQHLLSEYGVKLPDLRADTVERRLEDPELPDSVKELLRMRLNASKSSSAKYKRALEGHVHGRIHGAIQFCGAQRTGRDAGRILQPQNMARLDVDAVRAYHGLGIADKVKGPQIDQYLEDCREAITEGYADVMLADGVMSAAGNVLRGVIVAAPGKKLVVSDLANIEGRKLAWFAGEEWKLQAFRDFDAGVGLDLYILAYARAFAVDPGSVDEFMRQLGKVMELALGYYGGVGAFAAMAATYGIDLDDMAARAWPTLPSEVIADSRSKRAWALKDPKRREMVKGLAENTWLVCQSLVTLWRRAHPNTVQLWADVDAAARAAVETEGVKFEAGKLAFSRRGSWLRMHLPSKRVLCYPQIRVDDKGEMSYLGINQYTRQWARIKTYSGKLVENGDQASSRDVFKHGEKLANAQGYDGVLVVHDELVAETADTDEFTPEGLSRLLATNPPWAAGLPLAAKGWEGYRYRKG